MAGLHSEDYRTALSRHGLVASMSRKGDSWDNAVAESFFGSLKSSKPFLKVKGRIITDRA
jgi:transposase InsO family protein